MVTHYTSKSALSRTVWMLLLPYGYEFSREAASKERGFFTGEDNVTRLVPSNAVIVDFLLRTLQQWLSMLFSIGRTAPEIARFPWGYEPTSNATRVCSPIGISIDSAVRSRAHERH